MQTCIDRDPAVLQRFELLGFQARQYKPMLREIAKWVKCSGEETTVRRLKNLKNMLLHFIAGLPIDKSLWIATHRDGTPKGCFHVLFCKGTRSRRLVAVWNALMVTSAFVGETITKRQLAKFTKGVLRAQPDETGLGEVIRFIDLGLESLTEKLKVRPPEPIGDPIIAYIGSDKRRAPTGVTLSSGTAPEIETALTSVRSFAYGAAMQIAPHVLDGTLRGATEYYNQYVATTLENGISLYGLPPVIGRIAFLQEAGYKLRAIANPSRAWQQAFRPLQRWLETVARSLPGNWQFDQEKGRLAAQELLRKNSYACSIDLEGASDNIPLSLQLHVLRKLRVDEEWVQLVEYCSQGMWLLPKEAEDLLSELKEKDFKKPEFSVLRGVRGKKMIQWLQGQPLGLLFSFNLFSVTLGLLYEGVSYSLRNSDFEDPERVCRKRVQVGDDLVCFDPVEATMIRGLLQSAGIPVSKDKTIESTELCEFTSRLITKSKVISAPKWRAFDDNNFFDYAVAYGPGVFWVYPWKWRRLLYLLENVPEWYGGLGWNSKGTDLWTRSDPFRKLAEKLPIRPAVKLEAAGARARSLFYTSPIAAIESGSSMFDLSSTAMDDQSIKDLTRRVLPPRLLAQVEKFSAHGPLANDIIQLLSLARDVAYDASVTEEEFLGTLPQYLRSDYSYTIEYGESPSRAFLTSIDPLVRVESPVKEARPTTKRRQLERLVKLVGLS